MSLARLQRAFNAFILGQRLNALGVYFLRLGVEFTFVVLELRRQARTVGFNARQLFSQRGFTPNHASLPALGGGNAFLLLGDTAAAIFHLLNEVIFNLARRTLTLRRQIGELLVIRNPARAFEQLFGLRHLPLSHHPANVSKNPSHLVLRPNFRRTDALGLGKNRRKQ